MEAVYFMYLINSHMPGPATKPNKILNLMNEENRSKFPYT